MPLTTLNELQLLMTGNNTPSTYTASASAELFSAYLAFTNMRTGDPRSWLAVATTNSWLQIDLGAATTLSGYGVGEGNYSASPDSSTPKSWTFRGSSDPTFSSYTTLDTQTNVAGWVGTLGNWQYFPISPATFRYYRLNITANNGGAVFTGCYLKLFAPSSGGAVRGQGILQGGQF